MLIPKLALTLYERMNDRAWMHRITLSKPQSLQLDSRSFAICNFYFATEAPFPETQTSYPRPRYVAYD